MTSFCSVQSSGRCGPAWAPRPRPVTAPQRLLPSSPPHSGNLESQVSCPPQPEPASPRAQAGGPCCCGHTPRLEHGHLRHRVTCSAPPAASRPSPRCPRGRQANRPCFVRQVDMLIITEILVWLELRKDSLFQDVLLRGRVGACAKIRLFIKDLQEPRDQTHINWSPQTKNEEASCPSPGPRGPGMSAVGIASCPSHRPLAKGSGLCPFLRRA